MVATCGEFPIASRWLAIAESDSGDGYILGSIAGGLDDRSHNL